MKLERKLEEYKHRLTPQNADDMICRRIWKGLGLSGACNSYNIAKVEYNLWGFASSGKLDIERLMSIFANSIRKTGPSFLWAWETLEIKGDEDVQGRLDINQPSDEVDPPPLFLCRVKGTSTVLSYALFYTEEIGSMFTPPYRVITGCSDAHLVVQDIADFIKQFEPSLGEQI